MKILHINSYYNGSQFYEHIYNFQRQNHSITIYCHMSVEDINKVLDNDCIISRPYSKYDKFFYFLKHKKIWDDLIKKIDINNFDVIHAHSLFSNGFEAFKINKINKTPYIVSIRNTDINIFYKYFIHLRPLALKILLNATSIIFVSKPYKDYVISNYVPNKYKDSIQKKSFVVTNGIDDYWLVNTNSHPRHSNLLKIISIGVIDYNKNHITTCKSLECLEKKGYKISFDVIGKIIDKRAYLELCNYSFFNYHLPMPKEELLKKIRQNDIFVMPSYTETFGLVYAEAMTQGLPVVYTKGQGFDGQFDEGFVGYSVNANNYKEIVEKIEKCYQNYDYLSQNAIASSSRYRWIDINNYLMDIYEGKKNVF